MKNLANKRILKKKLKIFQKRMLTELEKNSHKQDILMSRSYDTIIREIEYHKAKMMIAIRMKNYEAANEYISDTANLLFCLGNTLGLYEKSFHEVDFNKRFELSKNPIILKLAENNTDHYY